MGTRLRRKGGSAGHRLSRIKEGMKQTPFLIEGANPLEKLPEGQQVVLLYRVSEGYFVPVIGDWVQTKQGILAPSGRAYFVSPVYREIMEQFDLWAEEPAGWLPLPEPETAPAIN